MQRTSSSATLSNAPLNTLCVGKQRPMSTFNCVCGARTRSPDEATGASGVLFRVEELQSLEERIALVVDEFASLPESGRAAWLAQRLGDRYPQGLARSQVLRDLVSREVNATGFSSTFRCPACKRLAIADAPMRTKWSFFAAD